MNIMNVKDFLALPVEEQEEIIRIHDEQKRIRQQHFSLVAERDRTNIAINELQKSCFHPFATKTHKSDTGNWDRSQDEYWTEFKCPDCGKHWREEGSV